MTTTFQIMIMATLILSLVAFATAGFTLRRPLASAFAGIVFAWIVFAWIVFDLLVL